MDAPPKRNRTQELLKNEKARLNAEIPLYMREALRAQAQSDDVHIYQLVKKYIRDGLRKDGWSV